MSENPFVPLKRDISPEGANKTQKTLLDFIFPPGGNLKGVLYQIKCQRAILESWGFKK
jgi:hypothetical protein